MQQFSRTVDQTDQLLDLWISILSQSEHTKRLIDNPSWEGGVSVSSSAAFATLIVLFLLDLSLLSLPSLFSSRMFSIA